MTCSQDRNAYVWTEEADGWHPSLVILRLTRGMFMFFILLCSLLLTHEVVLVLNGVQKKTNLPSEVLRLPSQFVIGMQMVTGGSQD